jgi:parallel beta-helix repeat protein
MKRGVILTLSVLLALYLSFSNAGLTKVAVEAQNGYPVHNLNTGLNYASIQEAINASETLGGHTIFVEEGNYSEHVVINKSLSITGELRNTTIVDGNGAGTVIIIAADNVSLVGFTIQGSNASAMTSGIYASQWTTGSNISHNIVMDNRKGIEFDYYCSNNTVNDNIIVSNNNDGIMFEIFAFNNTVQRNTVSMNNGDGISFRSGGGSNIIENNIVHSNRDDGIRIVNGDKMIVKGNWLHNNSLGIYMDDCSNSLISHNNATTNSGIPMHAIRLYGINNVVTNNLVLNSRDGIGIGSHSFNNTIISNTITHNVGNGISIGWYCSNNIIKKNAILDCSIGISLERADNNTVLHNNISMNEIGISITGSGNNTVLGNTISLSDMVGLNFVSTSNNRLIQNNIVNNDQQALVSHPANSWDNGLEGNFWSNYSGVDLNQDGIGDSPHVLGINNTDNYPLMGMFSKYNATSEQHVQTICNSTISEFQHNGTAISFNVTGEDSSAGFCRICIPTALMNEYQVFVNGTEVEYNLLPASNSTYSYLYFTYEHSTKEVVIIPELPSLILLPLFLLCTLLTAIFYRRKY